VSKSEKRYYPTQRDIERYLQGKLSSAEENLLEKAALDDPLLQDAIEGFSNQDGDTFKDVENLKSQFREKKGNNVYWKVAALVAMTIGTLLTMYILQTTSLSDQVAQKELTEPTIEQADVANIEPSQQEAKTPPALKEKETEPDLEEHLVEKEKTSFGEDVELKTEDLPTIALAETQDPIQEEEAFFQDLEAVDMSEAVVFEALPEEEQSFTNSKSVAPSRKLSSGARVAKKQSNELILGQILSSDLQPIDSVKITIENQPAFYSDENGEFLISLSEYNFPIQMTIRKSTFADTTLTIRSKDKIKIVLRKSL